MPCFIDEVDLFALVPTAPTQFPKLLVGLSRRQTRLPSPPFLSRMCQGGKREAKREEIQRSPRGKLFLYRSLSPRIIRCGARLRGGKSPLVSFPRRDSPRCRGEISLWLFCRQEGAGIKNEQPLFPKDPSSPFPFPFLVSYSTAREKASKKRGGKRFIAWRFPVNL